MARRAKTMGSAPAASAATTFVADAQGVPARIAAATAATAPGTDGGGFTPGQSTQNDIARLANVSQSTVQRILAGHPRVAPEKRRRVEAALAQTGYRLNTAARAIRSRRRGGVGIMTSSVSAEYVPGGLVTGIASAMAEADMQAIFMSAPAEELTRRDRVVDLPARLGVDGLLLLHIQPEGQATGETLAELLARYHMPTVWVNQRAIADCVYFDDEGDALRAVAALLERGHRRLAYVDLVSNNHYSRYDRLRGFGQGMAMAGLESTVFGGHCGKDAKQIEAAARALDEALAGPTPPTAYLCYSAADAGVVYRTALRRAPALLSELTLMAFATNEQYHGPAGAIDLGINAVRMDYHALGRLAAQTLIRKMADPDTPMAPVKLSNTLDFREGLEAPYRHD